MRKILITLIMILLLLFTIIVIRNGISLGNLEIWGVISLSEENDTIDAKNEELSTLVSVSYPTALANLKKSASTMEETKSEYEDKVILIGDGSNYLQTEEYEIEFLWTKLGNYANDNDVEIKIDVTNSSISGRYNLKFTVTGNYPDVTQFIYDIENDSELGFKIEEFNMVSSGDGVMATFACTEIKIDLNEVETTVIDKETEENTTNTTETTESTTNTTESSETTNSASSTEDTNTETTNNETNTESASTTNTTE